MDKKSKKEIEDSIVNLELHTSNIAGAIDVFKEVMSRHQKELDLLRDDKDFIEMNVRVNKCSDILGKLI